MSSRDGSGIYGSGFAAIYSLSWGKPFADRNGPALLALLPGPGRRPAPLRVLDLACGSGDMAAFLEPHGHRVHGVDASGAMIALARRSAPRATFGLWRFGQSSERLRGPFDAALCLYDSLNYAASLAVVRRTLAVLKAVLRPGGVLIFDVNTSHGHRARWRGCVAIENDAGFCACRFATTRSREGAETKIVGFARRKGGWIRFEESHHQISLNDAAVSSALRSARFSSFRALSAGARGLQAESGRRWWIARA